MCMCLLTSEREQEIKMKGKKMNNGCCSDIDQVN